MKVLIIEDERFAQQELIRILNILDSSIEVLKCIDTIKESVGYLADHNPELIFMDIQLADGLSFEIFSKVNVVAPVIFTTAYDEFAIRAFKVNSIDYLLKPLEEGNVQLALEKYRKLYQVGIQASTPDAEMIEKLLRSIAQPAYKNRLMVSVGDRIKHVDTKDIAYFKADGNTVFVICEDTSKYIVNYTLDELIPLINPTAFFRLNRTYLANISSIKDVRKYFNSRLKIFLVPDTKEEILVSRSRVPDFLRWMDS